MNDEELKKEWEGKISKIKEKDFDNVSTLGNFLEFIISNSNTKEKIRGSKELQDNYTHWKAVELKNLENLVYKDEITHITPPSNFVVIELEIKSKREEQDRYNQLLYSYLKENNITFACVHSGNKSYHFWIAHQNPLTPESRKTFIKKLLDKIEIPIKVLDPSSFQAEHIWPIAGIFRKQKNDFSRLIDYNEGYVVVFKDEKADESKLEMAVTSVQDQGKDLDFFLKILEPLLSKDYKHITLFVLTGILKKYLGYSKEDVLITIETIANRTGFELAQKTRKMVEQVYDHEKIEGKRLVGLNFLKQLCSNLGVEYIYKEVFNYVNKKNLTLEVTHTYLYEDNFKSFIFRFIDPITNEIMESETDSDSWESDLRKIFNLSKRQKIELYQEKLFETAKNSEIKKVNGYLSLKPNRIELDSIKPQSSELKMFFSLWLKKAEIGDVDVFVENFKKVIGMYDQYHKAVYTLIMSYSLTPHITAVLREEQHKSSHILLHGKTSSGKTATLTQLGGNEEESQSILDRKMRDTLFEKFGLIPVGETLTTFQKTENLQSILQMSSSIYNTARWWHQKKTAYKNLATLGFSHNNLFSAFPVVEDSILDALKARVWAFKFDPQIEQDKSQLKIMGKKLFMNCAAATKYLYENWPEGWNKENILESFYTNFSTYEQEKHAEAKLRIDCVTRFFNLPKVEIPEETKDEKKSILGHIELAVEQGYGVEVLNEGTLKGVDEIELFLFRSSIPILNRWGLRVTTLREVKELLNKEDQVESVVEKKRRCKINNESKVKHGLEITLKTF